MPTLLNGGRVLIRMRGEWGLESASDSALECVVTAAADDAEPCTWVSSTLAQDDQLGNHPWDQAHGILDAPDALGLESAAPIDCVEPDFEQSFPYELPEPGSMEESIARAEACQARPADGNWPYPPVRFAWHLDDDYSQLCSARVEVDDPGDGQRILIAILDTGYDPGHSTLPRHLRCDRARNFTGDGPVTNAIDPGSSYPLTNPGHGTATLALLAGNEMDRSQAPPFKGFLGGAPFADVVPVRIANSVIHFRTSAMARGIEYAAAVGCQVVSISMGGVPTQLWADAVNRAYERGMCIFAAAGNRIGPTPPATLVYPARFNRVVGVCGFTANKTPYYRPGFHRQMHGCFGPLAAMKTAMAAFTPNIPWAQMGCGALVNPDGAGTSSATPQCAAAATLWLQKHRPARAEKWRFVEAVRHALFSTADRSPVDGEYYVGNGLLRAKDALSVAFRDDLPQTPADDVSFPWLRLIGAVETVNDRDEVRQRMYETEALQLYLQTPSLQQITQDADPQTDELDRPTLKQLVQQLQQLPNASKALKRFLDSMASRL